MLKNICWLGKGLIDRFNGMATHQGVFYAYRVENHVYCTFIFTFLCSYICISIYVYICKFLSVSIYICICTRIIK